VLLDGRFAGGWRIERKGPEAILRLEPVLAPSGAQRRELIDEGGRLLAFVAGAAGRRDVMIAEPA